MGDFRVELNAVGGHGCQREVKDGGVVYGCGSMSCPDCIVAEFVSKLARSGANVKDATLTHWPGQSGEVKDSFIINEQPGINRARDKLSASRKRSGSF